MTNSNKPEDYRAPNDEEALERFNNYKSKDPFPEIPPALLNSADIFDYVAVTGMIHPFDDAKLKSESYAVHILGKVFYWDEKNDKQVKIIEKGQEFILRPNSIAFVTIEPKLRLPDYIAFRFNLKITNVYRGILLGTGPLVDPGFDGKLSIPLHNLTTNDYKFVGGEDLIWMEFTKLSPNQRWHTSDDNTSDSITRVGQYKEFPPGKALPDVEGYLRKADPHRSIRSSIPDILLNAKESAEKAKESAEKSAIKSEEAVKTADSIEKNLIFRLTVGGILTAIATGLALYFTINALTQDVTSLVQDSIYYVNNAQKDINLTQKELNSINQLRQEVQNLKQEVQDLKQENKLIKDKLSKQIEKVQ